MYTLNLEYPVTVNAEKHEYLMLRRSKVKDRLAVSKMKNVSTNILIKVCCQLVSFTVKCKPAVIYTVRASTDHAAEVCCLVDIFFECVVAEDNICQFSFSVWRLHFSQYAAIVCYFRYEAEVVG